MLTIHANSERFESLRNGRSVKQFAEQLDVSQSALSRVLSKKAEPGPRFIARVLHAVPHQFGDLFVVVDDPTIQDTRTR